MFIMPGENRGFLKMQPLEGMKKKSCILHSIEDAKASISIVTPLYPQSVYSHILVMFFVLFLLSKTVSSRIIPPPPKNK